MFKVEFIKFGFKHEMKYPKTFEGALKAAQSKGFNKSTDCWDATPHCAKIYEKAENGYGGYWVLIAKVDQTGSQLIPTEQREDYRSLEANRLRLVDQQRDIRNSMEHMQFVIESKKGIS